MVGEFGSSAPTLSTTRLAVPCPAASSPALAMVADELVRLHSAQALDLGSRRQQPRHAHDTSEGPSCPRASCLFRPDGTAHGRASSLLTFAHSCSIPQASICNRGYFSRSLSSALDTRLLRAL